MGWFPCRRRGLTHFDSPSNYKSKKGKIFAKIPDVVIRFFTVSTIAGSWVEAHESPIAIVLLVQSESTHNSDIGIKGSATNVTISRFARRLIAMVLILES